ncbi:MAG: proline dehydrogenase family protein [Anaerolineae bacterium]
MLRSLFIGMSANASARSFVTHFGPARRVARRFIAGETLDEAVAVVKDLNARGIKTIMNEVGESVTTRDEAVQAARSLQGLLRRIAADGLDSTISLKPSHVGMTFGPDFFFENVAGIVETARQLGNTVEVDIEGSADVDATLTAFHRLLDTFGGGLRLAIQAYLFRTPADVARLVERGAGIRLVKGAYHEPPEIALQGKADIRQAMIELMETILAPQAMARGAYLALGSHDPVLIAWLLNETKRREIAKDRFEIQMLQGIRRDEQQRLADLGYRMRVYIPYGTAWYPYFMRRLAERPANVLFMARAVFGG